MIEEDVIPTIKDKDGNIVTPSKEKDDIWLGIEKTAGVAMEAHLRA